MDFFYEFGTSTNLDCPEIRAVKRVLCRYTVTVIQKPTFFSYAKSSQNQRIFNRFHRPQTYTPFTRSSWLDELAIC